jgi:competence protein ComFC
VVLYGTIYLLLIEENYIALGGRIMNPIKLLGDWNEGYAIDVHTLKSEYLGEDDYGRPQYNTQRSELGEYLYELKYRGKRESAQKICQYINPFLKEWNLESIVNCIIPAPSSTKRTYQPVDDICNEIGKSLNKRVISNFLFKNGESQSKNLVLEEKKKLKGTIEQKKVFIEKVNILLVDDLYQSGETLNECVKVLRDDPNIERIYVLTITKTRR